MPATDILFRPFQLRGLALKNRIVMAPMTRTFAPEGIPGAAIAGTIAIVSLVTMFTNDDYRPGLYGVAAYYVLGVIYFAIAGRHRLVLSPEEEFALTQGERGVPQVSYATSAADQEAILRGEGAGTRTGPPPPEAPS